MTQLRQLTNRLIAISSDWNQYDLVPDRQKAEVRAIGSALNSSGGMAAMQAAYYEAKDRNRSASVIQGYWDGIGEWRW
jgi:hypothetical protein